MGKVSSRPSNDGAHDAAAGEAAASCRKQSPCGLSVPTWIACTGAMKRWWGVQAAGSHAFRGCEMHLGAARGGAGRHRLRSKQGGSWAGCIMMRNGWCVRMWEIYRHLILKRSRGRPRPALVPKTQRPTASPPLGAPWRHACKQTAEGEEWADARQRQGSGRVCVMPWMQDPC